MTKLHQKKNGKKKYASKKSAAMAMVGSIERSENDCKPIQMSMNELHRKMMIQRSTIQWTNKKNPTDDRTKKILSHNQQKKEEAVTICVERITNSMCNSFMFYDFSNVSAKRAHRNNNNRNARNIIKLN